MGSDVIIEGQCYACELHSQFLCPQCESFFCPNHASVFNKRLCMKCGPNTLKFEVQEGLEDKNGKIHEGRKYKLIGEGWPNELEKISVLTDQELDDKLFYYKNMLKEVVRTRDTLLITVSAFENETISRQTKKLRGSGQLASTGLHLGDSLKPQPIKASADVKQKAIEKLAKTLGITNEQAEKVYNKLKGIK